VKKPMKKAEQDDDWGAFDQPKSSKTGTVSQVS
jgi:hypothetical protein